MGVNEQGRQTGWAGRAGFVAGLGTVLVVEDEPLVRRVVAAALERVGYRVLTAGDGEEALSLARRERASIDLLLTDVVMPRLGRVDLVAKLRAEAAIRREPKGEATNMGPAGFEPATRRT